MISINLRKEDDMEAFDKLSEAFTDVNGAKDINVVYSKDSVWVNVNGVCVFRAINTAHLTFNGVPGA